MAIPRSGPALSCHSPSWGLMGLKEIPWEATPLKRPETGQDRPPLSNMVHFRFVTNTTRTWGSASSTSWPRDRWNNCLLLYTWLFSWYSWLCDYQFCSCPTLTSVPISNCLSPNCSLCFRLVTGSCCTSSARTATPTSSESSSGSWR